MNLVFTLSPRPRRFRSGPPGRLLSTGVFWLAVLGFPPLVSTAAGTAGVAQVSADSTRRTADKPIAEFFNVGITRAAFRNINPNDAAAAYMAVLETIGRRHGRHFKATTQIFDDPRVYEAAIRSGSFHVSVVGAWDYLSMHIDDVAKPQFVIVENGQIGRRYIVLTRRDSGLNALADLRGKNILKLDYAALGAAQGWLDTLLATNRLGPQERFFGSLEIVGKPSAAVLSVFFGKKSACVVDESSFKIMKELNPQVGMALQVVASSEKFADVVICIGNSGWPSDAVKAETIQALADLPQDPAGHQILTLFKIDQMVPFRDEYLDTIRQLQAVNARLALEDER